MSWMVASANQQIIFKRDNDGNYRCGAFDNLVAEKFEPYIPRYRKTFYKGRHKCWHPEPVFGRYIFISFDEHWPGVSKVRGVYSVLKPDAGLVRKPHSDVTPFLVSDDVIAEWKSREIDGFVKGIEESERVREMLIELAASSSIRITVC
jgi:hypothetical protein